jgi:hypothetical protein
MQYLFFYFYVLCFVSRASFVSLWMINELDTLNIFEKISASSWFIIHNAIFVSLIQDLCFVCPCSLLNFSKDVVEVWVVRATPNFPCSNVLNSVAFLPNSENHEILSSFLINMSLFFSGFNRHPA